MTLGTIILLAILAGIIRIAFINPRKARRERESQEYVIRCGYCGTRGHGIASCPEMHAEHGT